MKQASGRAGAVIPARLTAESVSLKRSGQQILDSVSFDAGAGKVMCVVGPSGCGKTTLLRAAAGLEGIDAGSISLDGRVLSGPGAFMPPEARMIGMVFQDYALFPHLTVAANVMFALNKLEAAKRTRIAMDALERVGLAAKADAYPDILSGGEQQRAALARAIVARPRVLLMDEPFSNLDRRMRDQVRDDAMDVLREIGATAVVVTHDPEEAMRIADHIVLMRQGRVVQAGTAEELYSRPADLQAARFFCPLNEIPGIIRGGLAETALGRFAAPGHAEGAKVIAGIRPEGMSVLADGQGIAAKLLKRRFLGDTDIAEAAIEGLELTVRLRGRLPAGLGQSSLVRLEINAKDVLVFPVKGA